MDKTKTKEIRNKHKQKLPVEYEGVSRFFFGKFFLLALSLFLSTLTVERYLVLLQGFENEDPIELKTEEEYFEFKSSEKNIV